MKAHDVMTRSVMSVQPHQSTQDAAKMLRDKGISAVPVIDANGVLAGMVSEGDLIGREDWEREARRDWWLTLLADGEELSPVFLATLKKPSFKVQDVMTTPVITVDENLDIKEIARKLIEHRIKRVPVVREGRVVGIVSRADLVEALARQ